MKKTFKRAGVAVLSMAMLISMGAVGAMTASATGEVTMTEQTITMPSTPAAAKYTIYPVATAAVNAGGKTYDYTLSSEFSDVTISSNAITIASIAATESNSTAAHNLAVALANDSSKPAATASNLNAGGIQSLTPGYYLITSSGTSMTAAPILLSVRSDMDAASKTLTAKSSDLTFDKNITAITNGSTDGLNPCKSAEGAVGSVVSYEIVTQFPTYAADVALKTGDKITTNFKITDNPSAGLTIDTSSISVAVTSPASDLQPAVTNDYKLTTSGVGTSNSGTGFEVEFTNDNYVLDNGGKTVTVTFTATINENAASQTAIPNDATLTFANDYNTGTGSDTKTDDTNVYRTDVKVYKNNTATNTPLAGAGFTLYKADDVNSDGTVKSGSTAFVAEKVTTVTSAATDGYITYNELPAGSYVLIETTVPDGFKKCDNIAVTVTAAKDGSSHKYTGAYTITPTYDVTCAAIKVDNTPGETLPGTGGMGTVIFTVGGAAIVLLAGAMFVVYMRRRKNEE